MMREETFAAYDRELEILTRLLLLKKHQKLMKY